MGMMSARLKTRAVKGTTLVILASSLTCRCQSSGAVIVSLSVDAETVVMRLSARRVTGAARRSMPATGRDRTAIIVSAAPVVTVGVQKAIEKRRVAESSHVISHNELRFGEAADASRESREGVSARAIRTWHLEEPADSSGWLP